MVKAILALCIKRKFWPTKQIKSSSIFHLIVETFSRIKRRIGYTPQTPEGRSSWKTEDRSHPTTINREKRLPNNAREYNLQHLETLRQLQIFSNETIKRPLKLLCRTFVPWAAETLLEGTSQASSHWENIQRTVEKSTVLLLQSRSLARLEQNLFCRSTAGIPQKHAVIYGRKNMWAYPFSKRLAYRSSNI